jgi:hypothetical protein
MTAEQIAKCYSACLDSVAIITDALNNPEKYADDTGVIERNVEHLELKVAETFWTDEDMTPITDVISLVRDEPV